MTDQETLQNDKIQRAVYAFLSAFIVGLGQIIKGNGKQGLKFLLWFYFGIPAIIYAGFNTNLAIFSVVFGASIFCLAGLWIYNVVDAYRK